MDKQVFEELRDQVVGTIGDFVFEKELEGKEAMDVVTDGFIEWMADRIAEQRMEASKQWDFINELGEHVSDQLWPRSCLAFERKIEGGK